MSAVVVGDHKFLATVKQNWSAAGWVAGGWIILISLSCEPIVLHLALLVTLEGKGEKPMWLLFNSFLFLCVCVCKHALYTESSLSLSLSPSFPSLSLS